jgi:hypothetical protein
MVPLLATLSERFSTVGLRRHGGLSGGGRQQLGLGQRAGVPTWALEQKAAANRQIIAVTRSVLAAGAQVPRMYQEPGLAWLERRTEVAEEMVAQRQAAAKRRR